MELYKFVGFECAEYHFKDKNSGRDINTKGYRLYFIQNVLGDNGEGLKTENLYFADNKLNGFDLHNNLNKDVNVRFNRYGKPQSIELYSK